MEKIGPKARFYRPPGVNDLEFFNIDVGDHCFTPHSHDHHALAIIEDGAFALQREQQVQTLYPGAIVYVAPDEVHGGKRVGNRPCRYSMVYISDHLMGQTLGASTLGRDPHYCPNVFAQILSLHTALDGTSKQNLIDRLQALLLDLKDLPDHNPPQSGERHPAIGKALNFLYQRKNANPDINGLAEHVGLHPAYLSRLFRQQIGLPPYAFNLDRKVQQARVMIAQGEPLADVAADLGFSDQSHLTRHFKQRFGVTPGSYARQIQG